MNFDRRMEASVGKSPEGEQLLMPSNRSPIQDFISVVASCFLFLLPILLSCSLLSFPVLSPFHPPPDFFLPTAPLVLPTLFLSLYSFIILYFLCNYLLTLYLYSFLCVRLPSFVTLFFPFYLHNYISPGLFLPSSLFPILLFPLHTFHFLRRLLLSAALIFFPLVPCSVQDPLNSVLSFYEFNFFSQIHFFSILID